MQVVSTAIRRWGTPQRLLSDNGLAFNPTRRGFTGKLVEYLQGLGVKPITGKPGHPTTQGKNERFRQTLQNWLNARPPAPTVAALQNLVDEFDEYYNNERVHQALNGKTPAQAWAATSPTSPPVAEPRMPPIPPSAVSSQAVYSQNNSEQPTRIERTRLALHATDGSADVKVRGNGQAKVLACCFYISTAHTGQIVHPIWNNTVVEFFDDANGEHLVTYPRPGATGWYYGPRNPNRTPMKGAGHSPATSTTGSVRPKISKGGYLGALTNKFYAGHKPAGEEIDVIWTATTVTINDTEGATISEYDKPTEKHDWHRPGWTTSTKP